MLAASSDGETAGQAFWVTVPTRNIYQVDLSTMVQTGNATATGTGGGDTAEPVIPVTGGEPTKPPEPGGGLPQ